MCWEKFNCILVKFLLMNIAIKQFILNVFNFKFLSLIFSDNISCFKICLWQFFLHNRHRIMTNYHVRFPIDLNSMLIWNFFFRFFPIIFVIQNIRAQSLPNHKHFEVYYSYKKACRVSIWRPIYRLIVDTLLQLFMKKWKYSIVRK